MPIFNGLKQLDSGEWVAHFNAGEITELISIGYTFHTDGSISDYPIIRQQDGYVLNEDNLRKIADRLGKDGTDNSEYVKAIEAIQNKREGLKRKTMTEEQIEDIQSRWDYISITPSGSKFTLVDKTYKEMRLALKENGNPIIKPVVEMMPYMFKGDVLEYSSLANGYFCALRRTK